MKQKSNKPAGPDEVRSRAKARLKKQSVRMALPTTEADAQRLLQELQIHQIELETQNAELQVARAQLETALEKYTDLYDFAPAGYFSIDELGTILEMNLTGAALLGTERSRLINRRFHGLMAAASRPVFFAFLKRVFAGPGKQICEVSLLREDGTSFWADVQATSTVFLRGSRKWCRVAVSDITALKRAEEAQRRMEDLTNANRKLEREILRRQAMETALKKSKADQNRLLNESQHLQEELRHLSHQVLQAQEEERKRISRDLHDQVAQVQVGINVHLAALTRQATVTSDALKEKIARTQRLVEESVDIVHRFARELRPMLLDDLGLVPALQSFMKEFTKRTGIHIRFTTFTSGRITELDSAKITVLYRVAQEALANVARHAQASQVLVILRKLPHAVHLEVTDDGKGFDVERVLIRNRHGRLGVVGMRERVQMVGGQYNVESALAKGTTIRAQIPLRNAAARGK